MLLEQLVGKKVGIWGTGVEGQASMEFIRKNLPALPLVIIEDNVVPPGLDVIVKTPGVSPYLPQAMKAKQDGVLFTSNLDLFFSHLQTQEKRPKIIFITGSKGKSSTATMMNHMLAGLGFNTRLCGNIGKPPLEFLGQDLDFMVFEISSYQAQGISFAAEYAAVLNISPTHLDWHLTFENYVRDKLSIIRPDSIAVLNGQDKLLRDFPHSAKKTIFVCGDDGIHARDGQFYDNGKHIPTPRLQIIGGHNMMNFCACVAILKDLGLDYEKAVMLMDGCAPLPHRLQTVHQSNGLAFVDDSIATSPQSAMAAVKTFPDADIAVLVGGYDNKSCDYAELSRFLQETENVRAIIGLPDTGSTIESSKLTMAANMADAVQKAIDALPGRKGLVLLSPAAQSFNMYKNYIQRGDDFAATARRLAP